MIDFEIAAMSAINNVFGDNVQIKGCFFFIHVDLYGENSTVRYLRVPSYVNSMCYE